MQDNSLLEGCRRRKLIGEEYPNYDVDRIKTGHRGTLWNPFAEYSYWTSYNKPLALSCLELMNMIDMMRMRGILKTKWLYQVYTLLQVTMEERIAYVQLFNGPLLRQADCKNKPDNTQFAY